MRLRLEPPRSMNRIAAFWRDTEPFVKNEAGHLIHRPRSVSVYNLHKKPHIAAHYYCGNGATDSHGKLTFVADPEESDLLCEVCERRAVMAGQPSASEVAGRHVHTGKLKAVRTCCDEVEA